MDEQTHMLCENAQYITIDVWPIIYGDDNKYDQDSRDVMLTIREWAEEFEYWWRSLDPDFREKLDYLEKIDKFAFEKAREYVENMEG